MLRTVIFDMFETLITHYQSPLYFSAQMAEDAGLPTEQFRLLWRGTEEARTVGKMTLEEALEMILREGGRYSDRLVRKMADKRLSVKEDCFRRLHPEILPLLHGLKEKGLMIGLISNCFSEEAAAIRHSDLFPFFDAACLSWELGVRKPDEAIFRRCADMLSAEPEECLYVGDGGSCELETARALGMTALQAAWYFGAGEPHPYERKPDFPQAEAPLEVLTFLEGQTALRRKEESTP